MAFSSLSVWALPVSKKKLRPLFNTNMPPISEKYGLRNHFPPLERSFLMRKCEKKGLIKKSLSSRF